MTIEQSSRFEEELEIIVDFIALDSPSHALSFFHALVSKIDNIPSNPYAYRKRTNSKDGNLREIIFKGYTIPFEIDEAKKKIVILGICNQNLWN